MKVNLKIITATMFFLMIMAICTTVQAASAKISASKTTVTAGDKVTITVNINAAAWNLNVSGSGVSGKITGYNADGKNASTTKTYTLTTSSAGTYTVSLIGDITDANDDFSDINKKVTVVANPKSTKPTTPTTGGGTSSGGTSSGGTTTQPKVEEKPTFTSVSKTVYTTGECNLRSSWSTSSSATTVAKGTQLKLTGTSTKTVNGYVWDRVEYNGATKYIANFLLTETKPVEEKKKESDKDKVVKEEQKQETKKEEEVKPQEDDKKLEEQKENITENKNEENTVNEGLKLSELNITGVDFSQGFDPDIYSYELQLNFFVSDLNLTAVANQEDARIEIVGNENFEEGENNIAILVTSADGSETVTYQIKVIVPQEATSLQNNLELYVIGGIAIIVAIIVITIIIKMRNKRKDNEDDGISDFDNDNDSDSNNDNADENDYTQRRTRRRNRGRHSN